MRRRWVELRHLRGTAQVAPSAARVWCVPLPPDARANELFQTELARGQRRTDQLFSYLLLAEWVAEILLALGVTPYTYAGASRGLHTHVLIALVLGGPIALFPIVAMNLGASARLRRHAVACAQMLSSALLIHLTGGRIETHFHIFGSLALLAFYLDWTVLVTATVIVAFDHFLRGLFWPESIYGFANPEWWRFLEHAFWVFFEVAFLHVSARQSLATMRAAAKRQADLEGSREQYRLLVETTGTIPWELDVATGRFRYVAPHAALLFGVDLAGIGLDRFLEERVRPEDRASAKQRWTEANATAQSFELQVKGAKGWIWIRNTIGADAPGEVEHGDRARRRSGGAPSRIARGVIFDITEARAREQELTQAQKLESVGRLASGIAHEINTPIQFVSDSVTFIQSAWHDVLALRDRYRKLIEPSKTLTAQMDREETSADLDYLLERTPMAIERSIEGLARVASIIKSMKEFAHPGGAEKAPADLKRGVLSTLTIATSEFKYVAELEVDIEELPPVMCHLGEINQVVLNLVVNAAHAVSDAIRPGGRGTITVRGRRDGDDVVLSVGDTGTGIPEEVRDRIFEPFFTTKEVGKGTGQGLALARSVVEKKHHGSLSFETELGKGTTFFVRIPIDGQPRETTPGPSLRAA